MEIFTVKIGKKRGRKKEDRREEKSRNERK
jgi:hypothetical protein